MAERNNKESSKSIDPELLKTIFQSILLGGASGIMRELNFTINCDIKGKVEKDRFEPDMNLSIKIGRDLDQVIKLKEQEAGVELAKQHLQMRRFDLLNRFTVSSGSPARIDPPIEGMGSVVSAEGTNHSSSD